MPSHMHASAIQHFVVPSALKKDVSDRSYTTAITSGSGLIGREGIGRDPGSLKFERDHEPCAGVQGGVALHNLPGHHREIEQQEGPRASKKGSGESVRLGRLGRIAQA